MIFQNVAIVGQTKKGGRLFLFLHSFHFLFDLASAISMNTLADYIFIANFLIKYVIDLKK